MESNSHLATIKNTLLLFMAIVIVMIIKELSGLLIPLAFALFIGILLSPIIEFLERKKWPYTISITVITIFTVAFLFLVGAIIMDTGAQIAEEKDVLLSQVTVKLDGILASVNYLPGFDTIESEGFVSVLNTV